MCRALALTTLALTSYVLAGVLSWQPTVRLVQDACQTPPSQGAHVALWPISLAMASGLRSRC